MEEFILIRPTSEYACQIAQYRQEFLDSGDSMDGTGPLRRLEDPEEYMSKPHSTVLDKDWLAWKKKSERNR